MKKLYILLILLCSTVYAFGQKAYSSDNPQYQWGEWAAKTCYKGVYVRTQKAYYNTLSKQWYWNIQIQNRYSKQVSLSWAIYDAGRVTDPPTYARHTFGSGTVYATGGFGGEHQVAVKIENLCFEFKMVNGTLMDNCSGVPNKDQFHYAECDNGTPNYRAGGGGGQGLTTGTSTTGLQTGATASQTTAQQNTDDPGTVMGLIHKKNDLCESLRQLVEKTGISSPAYDRYCVTAAAQQYTVKETARLKNEIAEMERGITALNKQYDAKQKEEEEKRRVAEAKQKEFDNLIAQGDAAYNSKSYDKAMGYYTQAKNAAQDDGHRNLAIQKYNQAFEAKRTAERETRVAAVKERDKQEDIAYLAGASATAGAMAMLSDGYVHRGFDFKLLAALGYAQTPLITNQTTQYAAKGSYADKASYPTIDFGMKFEILNNKPVNINIRGIYSVGLSALEKGVNGTYTDAGVDGGIQLWYKTVTKFKLFADLGWYERTGDRKRDEDAVSGGNSATDIVREGKYSYNVVRMGFGPMLHFRDSGKETWIKPGVYFDKLSFAKDKPKMLFMLNMNLYSSILMELSYANDYPPAGTISYPGAFTSAKQDYFTFKIIKQGRFW